MPEQHEVEQIRCPVCGMHAPKEQVEYGPYIIQLWVKKLGGKRALTEEERDERPFEKAFGRGSAPGILTYDEVDLPYEVKQMVREQIEKALELNS